MDTSERQSVRRALDSLKPYLESFLSQRQVPVEAAIRGQQRSGPDIQALLRACLASWDSTLSRQLPQVARSYVHELLDIRNRWAHEVAFSAAEAARALDTARVFGALIGVPTSNTKPVVPSISARPPKPARRETQRDVMARIFREAGRDEERAIREYAAAERRGDVLRKRNKHGIDAEAYARALINDGRKKGWLPQA